ncbi:GNAT family N-acetyltransferase [Rhizobium sp. TH2]|uniref:GNAT family N-acetyltransferase n=1 Tax=Rhizobium sp. TH2 TaxID=2775403 RepID=UPI0021587A5D|nr:GNAT family N-acetyltransferase [Rhizobium sp. TH2]UVC09003.1 GNAT family N-acetyltransferase [Rhizobium sp. TH2]
MVGQLEFRSDYFGDRAAFTALVDLLFDTFEIDIGQLDRLGGPDPTSMPFGYFDETGRCVANFSAFSTPLVINGRRVHAVGYQSGAVRPEYRGQGLYRDLMQRAFAWAEGQRFEFGMLLTDKPGLYTSYGFRVIKQHMFHGPMPAAAGVLPCRHLSIENDADVALIRSVLIQRMPVSERFAVTGHIEEFLLNACFDPSIRLSHMPDHDAIVAWREGAGTFHLLDIASRDIPLLAQVIAAVQTRAERAAVYFPTDRLGWTGETGRYEGSCDLMVTGDTDALLNSGPFMLSPLAEF